MLNHSTEPSTALCSLAKDNLRFMPQPYPGDYAMPSFQPYDDIPAIDDDSFTFRTDTPQMVMNFNWATLDPIMDQNPYVHGYSNFQPAKNPHIMRQHLDELEHSANGYTYPMALQIPEQAFSRLDIHSSWADPSRPVRYISPHGQFGGGSPAGSDTSTSERAFSPDATRHRASVSAHPRIAGNVYPSPAAELCYMGNSNGSWPQNLYIGGLASPCPSQNSVACNLKDLQYTPDTMEEDRFEDADTIRVRISHPEEPVLTPPEGASPADSGIGPSLDDNMSLNEEEDEYAVESEDTDTEYTPVRGARRQSTSIRRPAGRAPRRQRSLQSTAVHDPRTRVTKGSRKITSGTAKKNGMMKTDKDAAKQFTCTFSHYGCKAKFASKNEWKRHVASQHLQLGFYRCDVGSCAATSDGSSKGYNDFNRKDLFTQHHRRMHTPWGNPREGTKKQWEDFEETLEGVRDRCWRVRRAAPERSGCGFCGRVFEDAKDGERKEEGAGGGSGSSWEERMEHVGKHFERMGGEKLQEEEDEDLTTWAVRVGVVKDCGSKGCFLVGMEPKDGKVGDGRRRSGRRATKDEAGPDDDDDALGEAE